MAHRYASTPPGRPLTAVCALCGATHTAGTTGAPLVALRTHTVTDCLTRQGCRRHHRQHRHQGATSGRKAA